MTLASKTSLTLILDEQWTFRRVSKEDACPYLRNDTRERSFVEDVCVFALAIFWGATLHVMFQILVLNPK